MCMMCDGFNQEEMLDHHAALIEEHGFIVTGVDAVEVPWAYTVGLEDRTGHPELVLAGPIWEHSGRLLNEIGRAVLGGARFAAGDVWQSSDGVVRFGAVDPIQFRLGTFNVWLNLVSTGALETHMFRALQVFAPLEWFHRGHEKCQPDLSRPESRVGVAAPRSTRAMRRSRRP